MPTLDRTYTLIGRDGKPHLGRAPGKFDGHRGSKIYGRLDCRIALQAIARGGYVEHRVFFMDELTAVAAGYRPCAVCLSEEYEAWRRSRPIRNAKPKKVHSHEPVQGPRAKVSRSRKPYNTKFVRTLAQVVGLRDQLWRNQHLPPNIRGTAFQQAILDPLQEIPAGNSIPCTKIAPRIGAKTVAWKGAASNLAVTTPRDRVIGNDTSISGYALGIEIRCAHLAKEASV